MTDSYVSLVKSLPHDLQQLLVAYTLAFVERHHPIELTDYLDYLVFAKPYSGFSIEIISPLELVVQIDCLKMPFRSDCYDLSFLGDDQQVASVLTFKKLTVRGRSSRRDTERIEGLANIISVVFLRHKPIEVVIKSVDYWAEASFSFLQNVTRIEELDDGCIPKLLEDLHKLPKLEFVSVVTKSLFFYYEDFGNLCSKVKEVELLYRGGSAFFESPRLAELLDEHDNFGITTDLLEYTLAEDMKKFKNIHKIKQMIYSDPELESLEYLGDVGNVFRLDIHTMDSFLITSKLRSSSLKELSLSIRVISCDFSELTRLDTFLSHDQISFESFNTLPDCVSTVVLTTPNNTKFKANGTYKIPKYVSSLDVGRRYVHYLDMSNCVRLDELKFYQGLKGIDEDHEIWKTMPSTVRLIHMGYKTRARNGDKKLWGIRLSNPRTTSINFYDYQSYAIYLNTKNKIWTHKMHKDLTPFSRIDIVSKGKVSIRTDLRLSYLVCKDEDEGKVVTTSDSDSAFLDKRTLFAKIQKKDGFTLWSNEANV